MNEQMTSATQSADPRETSGPPWQISSDFVPGSVSVIVPTYNRRALVLQSLDSVVAQTYRPIELVVVDDGSTDGTADAVEEWFAGLSEERSRGLKLQVVRRSNGGLSCARNSGLAVSRGEFIQFLDSDDLLHPQKLQVQVGRLQADPTLDFVYSSLMGFESAPSWDASGGGDPRRENGIAHLAELNPIQGVARRSTFSQVGLWSEKIPYREDVEYYMRMYLAGVKTAFVPGLYAAGRKHTGERLTTSATAAIGLEALRAVADLVDAAEERDAPTGEFLASQFFRTGLGAAKRGEAGVAREAARCGLKYPCSPIRRCKLWALTALSARIVPDIVRRKAIERMLAFVRTAP